MKIRRIVPGLFLSLLLLPPGLAFAQDGGTNGTNRPPSVSITDPKNGAIFSAPANIAIWARVADTNGWVTSVEFFAGTNSLGVNTNITPTNSGQSPVHINWTNVPPGDYFLTAKATDNGGASTVSDPVVIYVRESNSYPTVSIIALSPDVISESGTNAGRFRITRNDASDTPLSVYLQLSGTASNGGDYLHRDNRITIEKGSTFADLIIQPIDDSLVESRESVIARLIYPEVVIAIWPPPVPPYVIDPQHSVASLWIEDNDSVTNQPPRVEIVAPTNFARFTAPANILLRATASDPDDAVARVEFYANQMFIGIGSKPTDSNFYSLMWSNVSAGSYSLQAKAIDARGAFTWSIARNIQVMGATNLPPVVWIVSPTNGSVFTAPANIFVHANATDSDGPVSTVEFFANDKSIALKTNLPTADILGPFHFVWTNVAAGSYILTARATDLRGASSLSAPVSIRVESRITNNTSWIVRRLPGGYIPAQPLPVHLRAEPRSNVVAYAAEDSPPAGWIVTNISDDGVFDAATGKVKFGPFFDHVARTLTYWVTPPAGETGIKEFSGIGSADGINVAIGGQHSIGPAPRHPADNNPADDFIRISELTAYSAAWRNGTEWPIGPNPIPISYVTRAATLWKGGEAYIFDVNVSEAPLWWINPGPRQTNSPVVPGTTDLTEAVSCDMPTNFVPGIAFSVHLQVRPPSATLAYAVEDRPAYGWMARNISDGGVIDAVSGKIKWGPFTDGQARALSYEVVPGTNPVSIATFVGTVCFDGVNFPIAGSRRISFGHEIPPIVIRSLVHLSNGDLVISFDGVPGVKYQVECSGNLIDWTPVATGYNVDGLLQLTDHPPADALKRFYRAVPVP